MSKKIVVLTRTENTHTDLEQRYPEIEWVDFPLIKFDYQELSPEIKYEIEENFDWLVFTSQNGVRSFFEQIEEIIDLKKKRIACVGPKTSALVEEFGYKTDFIPSHFTSLVLAKELPVTREETVCYVGGNLSRYETLKVLKEKARQFMQIEVYHTVSDMHEKDAWENLFSKKIDIISFCSPSAVKSYVNQLEKYELQTPENVRFASIGSTTEGAVRDELNAPSIIGSSHTFNAMIQGITKVLC